MNAASGNFEGRASSPRTTLGPSGTDSGTKKRKSHFFAGRFFLENAWKSRWNSCSAPKPAWLLAALNGSPLVRTFGAGSKKGEKCLDEGVKRGFPGALGCPWAAHWASRAHAANVRRVEVGGKEGAGDSVFLPSCMAGVATTVTACAHACSGGGLLSCIANDWPERGHPLPTVARFGERRMSGMAVTGLCEATDCPRKRA